MKRGVLERDAEVSVLADAVQAAAGGDGSVVLVMGEAGIGKSSLVEALRPHLPAEGRMFVGYCDDLATPRTLGPFRDLVGSVGTELSRAVQDGGDRDRVLAALRSELTWPEHPTVLVIEDVHWADDATLDALRYLIRRIAELPAVLVLTYRDDELSRAHALYGLLGHASRSDHVRRLPLRRLSPDAVRQLSAGSPVNAADLYALTAGNPFFVHELLASAQGEQVPPTIADAVLARVRRLDPGDPGRARPAGRRAVRSGTLAGRRARPRSRRRDRPGRRRGTRPAHRVHPEGLLPARADQAGHRRRGAIGAAHGAEPARPHRPDRARRIRRVADRPSRGAGR